MGIESKKVDKVKKANSWSTNLGYNNLGSYGSMRKEKRVDKDIAMQTL